MTHVDTIVFLSRKATIEWPSPWRMMSMQSLGFDVHRAGDPSPSPLRADPGHHFVRIGRKIRRGDGPNDGRKLVQCLDEQGHFDIERRHDLKDFLPRSAAFHDDACFGRTIGDDGAGLRCSRELQALHHTDPPSKQEVRKLMFEIDAPVIERLRSFPDAFRKCVVPKSDCGCGRDEGQRIPAKGAGVLAGKPDIAFGCD